MCLFGVNNLADKVVVILLRWDISYLNYYFESYKLKIFLDEISNYIVLRYYCNKRYNYIIFNVVKEMTTRTTFLKVSIMSSSLKYESYQSVSFLFTAFTECGGQCNCRKTIFHINWYILYWRKRRIHYAYYIAYSCICVNSNMRKPIIGTVFLVLVHWFEFLVFLLSNEWYKRY